MRILVERERSAVVFLITLCVATVGVSFGVKPVGTETETKPDKSIAAMVETGTIELVESVPIETTLDLPDLRNTPEVWSSMIQGAEQTIDIETFYMSGNDEGPDPLKSIVDELDEALERGVRLRVLSDASFAETYPKVLAWLSAHRGAEVRALDGRSVWGGVIHAKYFIVDDRDVFVGSQNWDWRALQHIHELGVRIQHTDAALTLKALFENDWELAGETAPSKSGEPASSQTTRNSSLGGPFYVETLEGEEVSMTIAASPKDDVPTGIQWDEPLLVQLMDRARMRIRLHLLTYNPVDRDGNYYAVLESALKRAAARGVEVRMILANWSKRDYILPHVRSLAATPGIAVRFTNIPQWSGGFIPYARVEHPKYLVADDDACWIATSNWTRGDFHESRNVSVFVEGEAFTERVAKYFENSWKSEYAEDVDLCKEYAVPRIGN